MKRHLIQLIKDDVKINVLITALEELKIGANRYSLSNSSIIFYLMGIKETEELTEKYNLLIDSATPKTITKLSSLDVFSDEVYKKLKTFAKITA